MTTTLGPQQAPTIYVHAFAEGSRDDADLFGGKGANLAEMARLGLPVPPGFVVTTEACRAYLSTGEDPAGLEAQILEHLHRLEERTGRRLGDPTDPLLVSVRSGARFSMPGMMETVLDVGLGDACVEALARSSGNLAFAWDSYRRLVQMYGRTVLGIGADHFEGLLDEARRRSGGDPTVGDLRRLVSDFKDVVRRLAGREFPQDPYAQLLGAVRAVFRSWNSPRAQAYRHAEGIPADLGTAVTVMAMVFGNMGEDSGTGVAFTRDPVTGARGAYGDYLPNAQGEDVVAGGHDTLPLAELEHRQPACHAALLRAIALLERHYRDLCDIEFTIERGHLWILQTRVGKRTPAAAFVIACALVDEGVLDLEEALRRVNGDQLSHVMFPAFDPSPGDVVLASGVPASPGAAVGALVLDSATAQAARVPVVLVRRETTPDDLPGMIAAQGVLTSHGGKTSHAAVVARGMGKPCVCGAQTLVVDTATRTVRVGATVLHEGDVVSMDGTTGLVYQGEVPVRPSPVTRYLETGEVPPRDDLVVAVHRLLAHADRVRRLGVQANADTPADAERARRLGAEGIGLCRTEHMFLGARRRIVEDLVLARTEEEQTHALAALLPLQREDFTGILRAMDGLPVTIRLIDPPLHEFLPSMADLAERVAWAEGAGAATPRLERDRDLLAAVRRIHEENPMLGLRGVRLGLMIPGLVGTQVRAVAEAAARLVREGLDPRPEIMVPLVASAREIAALRPEIDAAVAAVPDAPPMPIGTMIEVPRAALTAADIAAQAEFFSFGTNDLTQMGWGFSRDDVEAAFFPRYVSLGIFDRSPFETLDVMGIGRLIAIAVVEGRRARPGLRVGVCGEHGGDPASIDYFHDIGLDYVSCSPLRIPVARLEAGRAAVTVGAEASGSDTR